MCEIGPLHEEFVDFNQAGVKMDETKKLRKSEFWANMKWKCPSCEEELSNANISRHEFVDFNQAGVKMDETKKLRNSKKRKFPSCEEELSNANNSGRVCMKEATRWFIFGEPDYLEYQDSQIA
ncbi:Hypothetical predicted protein [Cloeon dipterum]|uniref:Uncharacterized protein n=1 Tax=Cloeon dipterum TaxID=197152 RepID=A0A8S1E4G3_9INSE|nr:Hypothetical predicted protein [Cloeon dipterum]